MSSNQTYNRPFWCRECDMSVHLLSSSAAAVGDDSLPPFCPHCHCLNLELMEDDDDPTPTPATTTTDINPSFLDSPSFRRFFLPFFGDFSPSDADEDDDDSDISLYDSIIPTIKINCSLLDDDEELVCAVCKDEFVVDVEAKLLPCDHLFHPQCILPWLNSNHNSCPLCRFQLPLASSNLDVSVTESSSSSSSSSSTESRASIDCTVTDNFISSVGFTHQDGLDCGFPDVGALSSFLPSHF